LSAICGTHFGADEARDLDLAQARGLQSVHEFDLDRGIHGLLFVLQPVARADFDERDVRWDHDLILGFEFCEGRAPQPRGSPYRAIRRTSGHI
jgi:hypothetical protein